MIEHCIILAAGRNSRLDNGIPKSLIAVGGKTLLERHFELFAAIGVKHIAVVVGYRGNMIADFVTEVKYKYQADIAIVENPSYDLENGYSLFAAKSWVAETNAGQFYFTMADHFFSERFLLAAQNARQQSLPSLLSLAVDTPGEHNSHIDLEDVTRVMAENGMIKVIGKGIPDYNYYDTGLFYASREILHYLEESIRNGKSSVSHMVSKLIQAGQASVVDLTGYFWSDVDTPEDLRRTLTLSEGK